MSKFTQAFLFIYSYEKRIMLKDEKEFVDYYACGDVLDENNAHAFPMIKDISNEDLDKRMTAEKYNEKRLVNLQATLKYVYLIEKDITAMAEEGINVCNSTSLKENVIGLHCYLTDLFLQDAFENNCHPSFYEHYEIDRQLFSYVHDIREWQIHKEALKNNDLQEKWLEATRFSELFYRMIISYLVDLLNHVKLMLALMVMRIAPMYSDNLSKMASELLEIFRYVLYDKRVRRIVVDPKDMEKCEKIGSKATTKMEIYFSLSNGDNYCLRLDYGHDEHNYVHLNLNEPGRSHGDSAFPIRIFDKEAEEVRHVCGDNFKDFFLVRDDCLWFKSGFDTRIERIELAEENKKLLEGINNNRKHYKLDGSVWSQCNAEDFSMELTEICNGLKMFDNPYESLGKNETTHFSYMRISDDLLEIVNQGMELAFDNSNFDTYLNEYRAKLNREISNIIPNDEYFKEEKEELLNAAEDIPFHEFIEYTYLLVNKSI